MSNSESKSVHTLQLPPDKLAGLHLWLAGNLAQSGLTNPQISEILAQKVSAECVTCQLKISGEELEVLSLTRGSPDSKNPKLSRLFLGYCGREGCKGRLYAVHFLEHPLVQWSAIADLDAPPTAPEAAPAEGPTRRAPVIPSARKPLILIGLALVLGYGVYYGIRYFTGGRIPLLQPKHTYQISPDSAPAWQKSDATNSLPQTPAPETGSKK
jgi:hypothetical protein